MPEPTKPTNDDWARAFAAAQRETGGDPFGPIDWDAFGLKPEQLFGPIEQRRNARSWRWTRRARAVALWALLVGGAFALGYFAYLIPGVRNP